MKLIGIVLSLAWSANLLSAQFLSPNTNLTAREQMIIAASKAAAAPQFNGAQVIGVRPGAPLVWSLAVSGVRPMEYSAKRLPVGLVLDAKTGIITGTLKEKGEFTFTATAKNSAGKARKDIKFFCGDNLALTQPMGWNSYDVIKPINGYYELT